MGKKSVTSITARAERKIANNSFLYREFTITAIPFTIRIIACATNLKHFNKIFKSLRNGFLRVLRFKLSSSIWFSLLKCFPSTTLLTVSGAKIAGATRIRAAMRSGASKYKFTAVRQPAECLARDSFNRLRDLGFR